MNLPDDDGNDDIWQACVAMIEGTPDDMTLDRKILSIALFLSVVALSVSNGNMRKAKELIADVADGAVVLAKKQQHTFREARQFPDVSRRKQ